MLNGIPGEIESSQTLSPRHDTRLQLGDGVVLQMKFAQTGHQFEDTFGEAGEAVLFQMEVSQLRETLKTKASEFGSCLNIYSKCSVASERPLKASGLRDGLGVRLTSLTKASVSR